MFHYSTGLNAYFGFVAVLCCTLCFFATYLSFLANVAENSVEFGVLRSLGLSTRQVSRRCTCRRVSLADRRLCSMQAQRVYIYEALAVVLTAFMLGTFVGIILAIALTVQQNLFTENVRVAREDTTHVRIQYLHISRHSCSSFRRLCLRSRWGPAWSWRLSQAITPHGPLHVCPSLASSRGGRRDLAGHAPAGVMLINKRFVK